MGTDNLHEKRKQGRKQRTSKELKKRAETWLFVCEGAETEPNYFEALFKYANQKSEKKIKFKTEGTGRNTESLVESVDSFFDCVDDLKGCVKIPYGKVFTVFDKDSFAKKQFNNAIYTSKKKGYIPIWSNECIELWFLLHFDFMQSNVVRGEYFKKLGRILKCSYKKSDDHFAMLDSANNLQTAVKNAKRLHKMFEDGSSCAEKAPCTTVFMVVEEIESYMGGIKL